MISNTVLLIMVFFVLLTLFSALAQVLLKTSANKVHPNKIMEYVNPYVISGYAIFVLCTLGSIYCYKTLDLKQGGVLQMSSYVFILVLDRLFFKQKIKLRKLLGMALIMAGIFIFYI